jgi:hypothetical protein
MSICPAGSLVNMRDEGGRVSRARCWTWRCEHCRRQKAKRVARQAAAGRPTTFITLTVRASLPGTADQKLTMLIRAWSIIRKRWIRQHPTQSVEYIMVVELTKAGQPHLHILARCKYIPHNWLSKQMGDLLDSPIVDIRAVKGEREAATYVSKYLSKSPQQIGHHHCVSRSRGYILDLPEQTKDVIAISAGTAFTTLSLEQIVIRLLERGFEPHIITPDLVVYGDCWEALAPDTS